MMNTAIVALVIATFAYTQKISSSIVGLVTDTSGAAVQGAEIIILNRGTGISISALTDTAGYYSVHNLLAGAYEIRTRKEGFASLQVGGIQVLTAQTVRQDLTLTVGEVQQSVSVIGSSPLVKTDSASIAGEITTRQINNLPVSFQSIDTLLTLVPGAQIAEGASNPKTGGVMFWGGTNFNVNGAAANDSSNGRGAVAFGTGMVALPPIGSLQEFKVNVSGMNAEYRMQSTVDLVTKQGSNTFHGEAYEYNQNKALAANTFLRNMAGQAKQPYNLNQFGGNLGGPIWRNKAFFLFQLCGFSTTLEFEPQADISVPANAAGGLLIPLFRLQLVRRLSGHEGDAVVQPLLRSTVFAKPSSLRSDNWSSKSDIAIPSLFD